MRYGYNSKVIWVKVKVKISVSDKDISQSHLGIYKMQGKLDDHKSRLPKETPT